MTQTKVRRGAQRFRLHTVVGTPTVYPNHKAFQAFRELPDNNRHWLFPKERASVITNLHMWSHETAKDAYPRESNTFTSHFIPQFTDELTREVQRVTQYVRQPNGLLLAELMSYDSYTQDAPSTVPYLLFQRLGRILNQGLFIYETKAGTSPAFKKRYPTVDVYIRKMIKSIQDDYEHILEERLAKTTQDQEFIVMSNVQSEMHYMISLWYSAFAHPLTTYIGDVVHTWDKTALQACKNLPYTVHMSPDCNTKLYNEYAIHIGSERF